MTDIARLRALAERAAPGEWTIMAGDLFCPSWPYWPEGEQREESRANGHITVLCWPGETPEEPDVEFRNHDATLAYIAAVNPQAVLALLAELETLRAREAEMRKGLELLLGTLETPWRPVPGCLFCEVDGSCTKQCNSSRISFARALLTPASPGEGGAKEKKESA